MRRPAVSRAIMMESLDIGSDRLEKIFAEANTICRYSRYLNGYRNNQLACR